MPAALILLSLFVLLQAPAPVVQSVDLAVPFQPVSFRQGDRDQIAYELHITSFQRTDVTLTAVRVESTRGSLIAYRAEDLYPPHHQARIAQRSSGPAGACARHARGASFLDSAA